MYESELQITIESVHKAGIEILKMRNEGVRYGHKSGRELVSEADLKVSEILRDSLTTPFPDTGWLSEEDTDTADRLQKERVWIVDPIDGTREFLQGFPEYAISVALAVQGNPVLGVVFNPATKETFSSISPAKNAFSNNQTNSIVSEGLNEYTVLISRGEHQFREVPPLPGTPTIITLGSVAYRLALLSTGKADLTLSGHARKEWDVAAGTALCLGNGIQVTDFLGEPLKFNQPFPSIRGFLAANPEMHKKIHEFQDLSYR